MSEPSRDIETELGELGFRRFGKATGRELTIEVRLPAEPAVYVAVVDDAVFWVGQTGNLRARFGDYSRWLALPDDSPRRDQRTRDKLLEMIAGRPLTFFWKPPITVESEITGHAYPAHQVEEAMLIDHFQPAWNMRKGGRRRG